MKKIISIGIIAVMLASLFVGLVPSSVASPGWIINGSTVEWDDVNVYLGATPHTTTSDGYVYFDVIPKTYTGDIDVVWGFDVPNVKPTKAEIYHPHWKNWTINHNQLLRNVSSFAPTLDKCDIGNIYNTHHYNVTHQIRSGNISTVVCFDSYQKVGNDYTIYWHTDHSKLILWKDISSSFTKINYDYGGMNTWYYVKNVPVVAGKSYQVRAWIDMPITIDGVSGKYWWAIKPSSESISDAIANEHFYCLDPWYNSNWNNRKLVTVSHVNNSGATFTNYPAFINVTKLSPMQADFDDIRFVDSSNNAMVFELENYTASYGLFWVNITSLPNTGMNFWMYYNNSGASAGENPEGVWDTNTKMVQLLNETPANDVAGHLDSTSNNNDGTPKNFDGTGTSSTNAVGKIDGADIFDSIDDYVDCGSGESLNITGAITIQMWIKILSGDSEAQYIFNRGDWNSKGFYVDTWRDTKIIQYTTNQNGISNYTEAACNYNFDEWYLLTVTRDGLIAHIYLNTTEVTTEYGDHIDPLGGAFPLKIGCGYWDDDVFNGTIDDLKIYNIVLTTDEIKQNYEMVVNQTTMVTWGSVQWDTTFTVSLPIGYTHPLFEPPNSTATNYPPNGQTSSQEFYNVSNSGNVNLDIRMKLNTTVSTITLKADTDNNPTGAQTIGTSLVTLYTGLAQGDTAGIWLWSDFDHTTPQTANRTVYINVSES